MPLPKNRSKKYRRVPRKTSKGTKIVFIRRRGLKASCAICKANLAGVGLGSKTQKSVSRKFGGHLCHACTSRIIKEVSRVREKAKSMDDVDLIYKSYVQQLAK